MHIYQDKIQLYLASTLELVGSLEHRIPERAQINQVVSLITDHNIIGKRTGYN